MIYSLIQQLIDEGIRRGLIEPEDEIYVRNRLLALLKLDWFPREKPAYALLGNRDEDVIIPDLLEAIVAGAVSRGVIGDDFEEKEIFAAKLMDCFVGRPSEVNRIFREKYRRSPREATDYFYALSKSSNYIQMKRIRKNICYKVPTEFGEIDITINLSKPEKDPRQIAKLKGLPQTSSYPLCPLCVENEGYEGQPGFAPRTNHRMIRIELEGEEWFFQYSPYAYFNEHCIVLSREHRDMEINRKTFARLFAFLDQFPHYFIGSNADLPIVGGSILNHDHYQGGRYEFPMAKAPLESIFHLHHFPEVACGIVKWPMSAIRLSGDQKDKIIELADWILQSWKEYSDPEVDILASTGGVRHNTITPIARKRHGQYELDLVLRNNRTTEEHPLGIFHPHQDVHHIKKENIGLIEVMGLAVLPARLKRELTEVADFLAGKTDTVADYHLDWATWMKERYGTVPRKEAAGIIRNELGRKFLKVLSDAGVFKRDERGRAAFRKFIDYLDRA
jgi:UTP-hexose-1-phosphate uridylyltransferase (EC 2.7.7.10)